MTDNTSFAPLNDDDQELMDAIAAAFGADAVEAIQDELSSESGEGDSLADIVRSIDGRLVDNSANDTSTFDESEAGVERYIVVEIGGSRFGILMANVLEIQHVPQVTHLPKVPEWVLGVVNIRGTIMSVCALNSIIGVPPTETSGAARRLIVAQSLVDEIDAGVIVDRVVGIRTIPVAQIEPPTAFVNEHLSAYLQGVYTQADSVVALLDMEKLMLSSNFRQFETV